MLFMSIYDYKLDLIGTVGVSPDGGAGAKYRWGRFKWRFSTSMELLIFSGAINAVLW